LGDRDVMQSSGQRAETARDRPTEDLNV